MAYRFFSRKALINLLLSAAATGDIEVLQRYLPEYDCRAWDLYESWKHHRIFRIPDVDGKTLAASGTGQTLLILSSRKNHLECVRMLLAYNAQIEARDKCGATALMAAARYGHARIVEILLQHGAEVDAKCNYGFTPLLWACRRGYFDVARSLVAHGANINAQQNQQDSDQLTPLMFAASSGNARIVTLLLDASADVDATNHLGVTALIRACEYGQLAVVEALVLRGSANVVHVTSVNLECGLIKAARNGYSAVTGFLLAHGAEPATMTPPTCRTGTTALIVAASGGHREVVRQILDALLGLGPSDRNRDRDKDNDRVRTVLLTRQFHNNVTANTLTAVEAAVKYGHLQCAEDLGEFMLRHGHCHVTDLPEAVWDMPAVTDERGWGQRKSYIVLVEGCTRDAWGAIADYLLDDLVSREICTYLWLG